MNIENAHFTDTLSAQRGRFRCALGRKTIFCLTKDSLMGLKGNRFSLCVLSGHTLITKKKLPKKNNLVLLFTFRVLILRQTYR